MTAVLQTKFRMHIPSVIIFFDLRSSRKNTVEQEHSHVLLSFRSFIVLFFKIRHPFHSFMYYGNLLFSIVSLENFASLTQGHTHVCSCSPLMVLMFINLCYKHTTLMSFLTKLWITYWSALSIRTNNNLILQFTVTEKRVIKCKPYTLIVELYCICSVPYWRTDEIGLRMAACESCKRWFHRKCEKIPAVVFSAGKQWSCLNCRYLIG